MRLFILLHLIVYLLVSGTQVEAQSLPVTTEASSACTIALQSDNKPKGVYEERRYKILGYNVENLFMRKGAYERSYGNRMRRIDKGAKNRSEIKDPEDIKRIAKTILNNDPDFMILTEVEDNAADQFNKDFLESRYEVHCVRGNDPRGIEVAILVKKSLGLVGEYISHKDMKWNDPASHEVLPVFSRDLPVLLLRESASAEPILALLGTHAKSQRDRPGDPNSSLWRAKQYEETAKIMQDLRIKFPNTPLILGGDYNTDVRKNVNTRSDKELSPVRGVTQDAFDVAKESLPPDQRITHSYFPNGSNYAQRSQLDTFLINAGEQMDIEKTQILPNYDSRGNVMGLAQSYRERSWQASDHNAILMNFTLRIKKK